jgi:rubredoxin
MLFGFLRRLWFRPQPGTRPTAPRCPHCGQALVWHKGQLFPEPEEAVAAARARFQAIRGEWRCPRCSDTPRRSAA